MFEKRRLIFFREIKWKLQFLIMKNEWKNEDFLINKKD